MKKLACFLICLIAGVSCSKSPEMEDAVPRDLSVATRTITPHTNPYINWEDTTKINIVDHGLVTLPWYNGSAGAIPDYILQDYKQADGWELVYNFCSDEAENIGGNKNYLIFYNKLTGKLRVYYYNKETVTNGTMTVAQFRTSTKTQLFCFNKGYFSTHSYRGNDTPIEVCTSNITTSKSGATAFGWNCFEVELSYHPTDTNEHFSIGFYDKNIKTLRLSGILNLETDGTIITTDISNAATPLLGLAGNAAGAAMQDAYAKGYKKKNDRDPGGFGKALGALGGKIVSSGLNLIFGSFLGRFDKTTETRSTVDLKTTGKAEFEGEEQSNIASAITPIQNLLIPGSPASSSDHIIPLYNQPLGAWTLTCVPEVSMDDVLTPKVYPALSSPSGYKAFYVDYERCLYRTEFFKEYVIVNPETMACISDYDVKVDYYVISKFDGQYYLDDIGNSNQYLTKCAYEEKFDDKEYNPDEKYNQVFSYPEEYLKTKTIFYELDDSYAELEISKPDMPHLYPAWMDDSAILSNLQATVQYKRPQRDFYTNYMVKVSVIFYPKPPYNQTPVLSTKTFRPQIVIRPVARPPIRLQNPWMKSEYRSKDYLWTHKWDWAK